MLVPTTTKLFDEAGWTATKIKAHQREELDQLLCLCVMPARLTPENIAAVPGNTPGALHCRNGQWRQGQASLQQKLYRFPVPLGNGMA